MAKYGFAPDPEHPYASVLVRRVKFLEQSISEVRLRLSDYRESNIRLGIRYTDLFMKDPFTAILLWTDLRRAEPPKLHAPGTLWTQSNARVALRSLLTFGIPWLDHYSRPKALIDCLEKHLKETNAPGDHEHLGLLYYEMGQFRKGCEHAQAWLDLIPRTRSWVGERARTRRQLKAMKCNCK